MSPQSSLKTAPAGCVSIRGPSLERASSSESAQTVLWMSKMRLCWPRGMTEVAAISMSWLMLGIIWRYVVR